MAEKGQWIVTFQPVTDWVQQHDLRVRGGKGGVEGSIFPQRMQQWMLLSNKADGPLFI
jgi:hypothetical protein